MVGRLLRALGASAHARDTIIVFWSDNGWHLGEKQYWHKSTLWQRSTHVPLIIWAPGIREPGLGLDGTSLVPLLRDPRSKRGNPAVTTYWNGNHSVRDERWRYTRYVDGGEELYDCAADPNEWRNLAAGGKYDRIKQELGRWIPKTSAPPKPVRADYDFDFATYQYRLKKPN